MKNHLLLFSAACILIAIIFSGCHTSRKVASRSSRQPKFIDDVYMNGHSKNNMTVSGTPHSNRTTPKNIDPATEKAEDIPPLSKKELSSIRKKYAEMMGVKSKDLSENALYEFIEAWYGTNYHLGGSGHSGIDCSGFAKKLYSEVYDVDISRTAAEQFSNSKIIKHSVDANEGDLVFFHARGRHITHVGVYLVNDYFVHASTSQGVMISSLNEDYWHKHYAGIGRVKQ